MLLSILFVGTKYRYNDALRDYILRQARLHYGDTPWRLYYYKEGQKSLILDLERIISQGGDILIVASKQSFPTVSKIICTVTEDNLVLKEDILIPSKSKLYEGASYLVVYKDAKINPLMIDEGQKMPRILLDSAKERARIQLFGEDESSARLLLGTLSQTFDVHLEFVPIVKGWLELHITGKRYGNVAEFIHSAKQLLPKKIILANNIGAYIIQKLSEHNMRLTFAESCTGGLLSYYLTRSEGASKIFEGSLVVYSNRLKSNWLAVDEEVLEQMGAVSKETVAQMSEGALRVSEADLAIAISGIAGSGGGTPQKPVGTVFIGVRSRQKHIEEHLLLSGDRNYIQHQSALHAIRLLLTHHQDLFF